MKIANGHEHLYNENGQTLDLMLRTMDELGIEFTCLAPGPVDFWQKYDCNDRVEQALKAHPDRIKGMGWVDLGVDQSGKVQELKNRGFTGLKLIFPRVPYNDERVIDIYREAERLRMPCLFHLGVVGGGSHVQRAPRLQFDSSRMMPILLDIIPYECPELRIIGAHMGGTDFNTAWMMTQRHSHLYLDISGHMLMREHCPREFYAYSIVNWNRSLPKFIFGTDRHYTNWAADLRRSLNLLDNIWQVDAATRDKIMYANLAGILDWSSGK